MISVCIPVYNVDVRKLAGTLSAQTAKLSENGISIEIILLDDGSDEKFREINRELSDAGEKVRYIEMDENIGRSRIRNKFSEYAKYDHLLFLDCDLEIPSEDFLRLYADTINENPVKVVCGGLQYNPEKPPRNKHLRWKYGRIRESQSLETRIQHPNRSFMSSNLIIPLSLFRENQFDERLDGYGHEDSLFGYELSRNGHEIMHIDNPVIHEGIETNREFVSKTTAAVVNLVHIIRLTADDPGFKDSVKLVRTSEKLKSSGSAGIIRGFSVISIPLCRFLLDAGCTSLKLLDLYKLGVFLKADQDN